MKTVDMIVRDVLNNAKEYSIYDIEEVLNYIAQEKKKELGINFLFNTIYDEGACVKSERTKQGLLQVEIGYKDIYDIIESKELKKLELPDAKIAIQNISQLEERKVFIELILSVFHELRHVKQIDNITDHAVFNDDTIRMTRETIINKFFPGFINIYNYEQSILEIDAMKASLKETVEFFQSLGVDISPNEIFAVMREKELSYLKYNIQMFGDSYESAIAYFDQIYGNIQYVDGISDSIKLLSENEKAKLFEKCQDLIAAYSEETDVDKKLDILVSISLRMKPELAEVYPLIHEKRKMYHR